MKQLFSAMACAVMICAPIHSAHAQRAHIPFYKHYNEALAAGDFATAATAGEQAWRAAEADLGDHQTTAILAYNYAALIYFTLPEKAIEPLERVVAILGEGSDMFGAEPPGLMLAFARASADDDKTLKAALRAKLEAAEAATSETTILSARGWFLVGADELGRRRFKNAVDALSISLRHFDDFQKYAPMEVARALIARGMAYVAGQNRNNEDIVNANFDFNNAIALFPPQTSIETFDPLLATAVAWDAVARIAAKTDNKKGLTPGSNFERKAPKLKGDERVKWAKAKPPHESCLLDWKPRKRATFPSADVSRRLIGGVLIGFHIEGAKVVDARVLAEVPERSRFGERALSAVSTWELKTPLINEACGKNILSVYQFILD